MRWNKRKPSERQRIVRNTFARLERLAEKLVYFPENCSDEDRQRFVTESAQLKSKLLSAGTNHARHKLERLVCGVERGNLL